MKAIVYREYGGPEVVKLEEVERPVIADTDVLVKVHAASLNGSDWEALCGRPLYARLGGLVRPRRQRLGSDIAGRVESVGRRVTKFKPGDAVFGDILIYLGGFAEYARAPEKALALKPDGITFEEVAAIPQAAVIALQGIRDSGLVQPGTKVLINGGGGGAGAFAIQLAKLHGAEVTGVDNTGKQAFMRTLGADHVVDFTREDFTKSGREYDLILDIFAYRSVFAYLRALKPGGSYLFTGGSVATIFQILLLGPFIRLATGKRVRLLIVRPNPEDMLAVADLQKAGKIRPVIDRRYRLEEVPAALRYLGEGRAQGKVVITLEQNSPPVMRPA